MAFWKRLFSDGQADERVDYYREGLELLQAGKFHEALTSLRLALRDAPGDAAVLQQIAIAQTRIGTTDEAIRTYRQVLERDPHAVGAHYGLAFLLLRDGRRDEAVEHLRAFLAAPPGSADAEQHISHARETLATLTGAPKEEAEH
jgi:tetratricopeptide (TPR) repeat protein